MSSRAPGPLSSRATIAHVALIVPWIALVVDSFDSIRDNSFLWHVRAGDLQAMAGEVLTSDPFSFTMLGEPWMTQSWLAELGYTWFEGGVGLGFVGPMMLLAGVIAFAAIGMTAYRRTGSVVAASIVLLLSTVLMLQFLVPRPALLSYPLFALAILAWDRPGSRWTMPFLFWIWASVHASFAIGLAYIGFRIISKRDWRQIPFAVVAGVATLVTAHGIGTLSVLTDFATSGDYLSLVSEWRTPDFLELDMLPVFAGLVLLVYGAAKNRIDVNDLWVIVPFLALAFSAERAVATAWIGLAPFIAQSVPFKPPLRGLSRAVVIATAGVILILPFLMIEEVVVDEEVFPVAAVAEMESARTFHDDFTGGYLIWRKGPELSVYIDDRVELYGERIEEFVDIRSGREDWKPVFERDGIEQALLENDEPLIGSLEAAGWDVGYRDDFYTILTPPPS